MRLHESWVWESRAGSGTSIVEEAGVEDEVGIADA